MLKMSRFGKSEERANKWPQTPQNLSVELCVAGAGTVLRDPRNNKMLFSHKIVRRRRMKLVISNRSPSVWGFAPFVRHDSLCYVYLRNVLHATFLEPRGQSKSRRAEQTQQRGSHARVPNTSRCVPVSNERVQDSTCIVRGTNGIDTRKQRPLWPNQEGVYGAHVVARTYITANAVSHSSPLNDGRATQQWRQNR